MRILTQIRKFANSQMAPLPDPSAGLPVDPSAGLPADPSARGLHLHCAYSRDPTSGTQAEMSLTVVATSVSH
jgi:hypothetical protein